MCIELWSHHTKRSIELELLEIIEDKNQEVFMSRKWENYVWFINISLRYEYVQWKNSSPIWYVEWIYVREKYRGKGIAKWLVECAQKWMKEMWCKEIASDTHIENTVSQEFHKKLWFDIAWTIIHFIKKLD